MKNLLSLILVGLSISCTSIVKKKIDPTALTSTTSNHTIDEAVCMQDSMLKVILKNGIRNINGRQVISDPNIKFFSGYSDNFSFSRYELASKASKIEFIDTIYEGHTFKADKRNVYINNMLSSMCKIKDNNFILDSMEMHIVYTESEFYTFTNNPLYLLVVSHLMNWVGNMANFSFFQLIYLKENTVMEFVREDV